MNAKIPLAVRRIFAVLGACLGSTVAVRATDPAVVISPASPGTYTYAQNFDSGLPTSGSGAWVNSSTIPGWYVQQQYQGTTTITAGAGASNTVGVYSFGTGTDSDRALGAIAGGVAGGVAFAVQFQNKTHTTVTLGTMTYTGEQWRNSANASAQVLKMWYRRGFTSYVELNPGNDDSSDVPLVWTPLPSGDFTAPVTGGSAGALDGNSSGNRVTPITVDLSGITLKDGEFITIRFNDERLSGANHGVAIDDFSLGYTINNAATVTSGAIEIAPGTGIRTYSQTFDSLPPTGGPFDWTDNSTIGGWYSQRTGSTATRLLVSDGSINTTGLYSFGSTSSSDRALGAIPGGASTGSVAWGALFHNVSGNTVTFHNLAYRGEQWHDGSGDQDTVTAWYKVSSSPITSVDPGSSNTGWQTLSSLNFAALHHGTTTGALDGNNAANYSQLNSDIDVTIEDGEYLMIRFSDVSQNGANQGLSIDDFSLQYTVNRNDVVLRPESYGVWLQTNVNLNNLEPAIVQNDPGLPQYQGVHMAFSWSVLEPDYSATTDPGNFDWTYFDAQMQAADDADIPYCSITITVGPAAPAWLFLDWTGPSNGGVPRVKTNGGSRSDFPYYLDENYKAYYYRLIAAVADRVRNNPNGYAVQVAFVEVATGSTLDEAPYKGDTPQFATTGAGHNVDDDATITDEQWLDFRLDAFEQYNNEFQLADNAFIPLLFNRVMSGDDNAAQAWIIDHVFGGWGSKEATGHYYQLNDSNVYPRDFLAHLIDPAPGDWAIFTRCEEDQTWNGGQGGGNNIGLFPPNIPMSFYWEALEATHNGLSVWHVTQSALDWCETNEYWDWMTFFNKYALQTRAETAVNAFCAFREGLDAADASKYPKSTAGVNAHGDNAFGQPGLGTEQRYIDITDPAMYSYVVLPSPRPVASYYSRGAGMDTPDAVNGGQVSQRGDQTRVNDVGFNIARGNYERFLHQLDPEGTSVGWWRVGATTTYTPTVTDVDTTLPTGYTTLDVTDLPPEARFARGFEHASSRDTMYFDITDAFFQGGPLAGVYPVQVRIHYYDVGTGTWALKYDSTSGGGQKQAILSPGNVDGSVTNGNTGTWKDVTVTLSDANFGNQGPNGSDLMLVYVTPDSGGADPIFHMIELTKDP